MNANLYNGKSRKLQLTSSAILIFALSVLILVQLYSFAITDWTIKQSEWSEKIYAYKYAALNAIIVLARLSMLFAMALVMFRYSVRDSYGAVYTFLLLLFCSAHTLLAMFDRGFGTTLYSTNLPLNYLLVLGFFVGARGTSWPKLKRFILPFALIYLAGFTFEFVTSYVRYGWVIYQNSSLMAYFSNAFWLVVTMIYIRISEKKTGFLLYLFPTILLIGAVIIRARSWVIQAALLLVITVIAAVWSKRKGSFRIIRILILTAVLFAVAAIILSNYFGTFWESVLDKGVKDTRSIQYVEIFSQTPWYKWILGQGMTATYQSSYYGEYSSIDNQFVYMSFHYGVIFALLYFVPYLVAIFKAWKARKTAPTLLLGAVLILLWLFSVNGLSIFNGIVLDVKSFLMPFLAGHIYQISKESLQSKEVG